MWRCTYTYSVQRLRYEATASRSLYPCMPVNEGSCERLEGWTWNGPWGSSYPYDHYKILSTTEVHTLPAICSCAPTGCA